MPELPEVQTVVNDLRRKVIGRRIVGVWFDWPKMIKGDGHAAFVKNVKGAKILKIDRRAKNILIGLSGDKLLLIHQKMTGHLLVGKWTLRQAQGKKYKIIPLEPPAVVSDPYNSYIHLIFYLDDGRMLALSDLRKFAKVIVGPIEKVEKLPELVKLGPDALDPDLKFVNFLKLIKSEKRKIKQVLMDQETIAGIGNIYSDDILWEAKIHPFRPAGSLSVEELKNLWLAMRKILKKALKLRGTSTSDFRDTAGKPGGYTNERLVYQREDEPCPRCGAKIKRIKIGGRSAHYCPKCQTLNPKS